MLVMGASFNSRPVVSLCPSNLGSRALAYPPELGPRPDPPSLLVAFGVHFGSTCGRSRGHPLPPATGSFALDFAVTFQLLLPTLKLVLTPRHPNRDREQILATQECKWLPQGFALIHGRAPPWPKPLLMLPGKVILCFCCCRPPLPVSLVPASILV